MEVVYILEPTVYNIECIAADYTKVPPRYAGAHIFFSSGFNGSIERKVLNSSIGRHLRSMQEICIDFKPMESHTFSLGDPYALEKFYNESCMDLLTGALHKIALQLVSVCATLGEYPIIRFYNADKTDHNLRKLPYMLAREFQNELDRYARDHANFPDTSEKRPRAVFLILDRAVDWIAPLLHEFTYQAIAYDLLDMKDWREYSYMENIQGKEQQQLGKLSDKDPEWVSSRHAHIGTTGEKLGQKLAQLKKENPHLADASKEAKVTDLKDMMLGLSSFNEQRARYVFHIAMASECMAQVEQRNLIELAEVEQVCATGMQDEKTKAKGVAETVVMTLADERLAPRDKVRLIILYGIYRGGLVEADYIKLLHHCNLSNEEMVGIYSYYQKLGAPLLKSSPRDRPSKDQLPTRFDSQLGGDCMASSRYVPGVYNIVKLLAQGKLPAAMFPYIKDQPTEDEDSGDYQSGSLRSQRQIATWANPTNKGAVKQRIFVFMAGGMTASETRSCYELSQTNTMNKEIIVGGTDFTSPNKFLDSLRRLTMPRNRLDLPEDKPVPTSAPKHLYESDREVKKAQATPAASAPGVKGKVAPQAGNSTAQQASANSQYAKEKDKKNRFKKFFK